MLLRFLEHRSAPSALIRGSWAMALSLLACGVPAQPGRAAQGSTSALVPLGQLPLCFEADRAPSNGQRRFLARGPNYQFRIGATQAEIALRKCEGPIPISPLERNGTLGLKAAVARQVALQFVHANPRASLGGEGEMPGKLNYLLGSDPAKWRTGLPTYAKVRVEDLYPGINLVYYGNQRQLEYDFNVAAGADPASIAIHFAGVDRVTITQEGELVLTVGAEEIRQPRPVLYQVSPHGTQTVAGGYCLKDSRTVAFAVGQYDHDRPLIIDPVLSYSTFFGGTGGDMAFSVKLDPEGFIYIAGETLSTQFPFAIPSSAFEGEFQGGVVNGDAFVAKLDNSGSNLVYFTYLGGSGNDGIFDLAVDSAGHAYVTGFTDSPDFPVVPVGVGVPGLATNISGTLDPRFNAFPVDAIVAELNADGSGLIYSTYLGGSSTDIAGGIALDPAGNTYVTGNTYSTNFPTTNALVFQLGGTTNMLLDHLAGSNDVFVTKIAPAGAGLIYSTYLGGTNVDEGGGIAADAEGFAFVTGYTASTNFPITADALQKDINLQTNAVSFFHHKPVPFDGFIAKIAPVGSELVYSTYFGGSGSDSGFRIRLDASGNAYVTGSSQSPDFPNTITNLIHIGITNFNLPNSDAFLAKLNPQGGLVYSALFGSGYPFNDVGWDLAVNPVTSDAYVVGIASTNFPTTNAVGFPPVDKIHRGSPCAFVTVFNTDASALLYSVILGGSGDDRGYSIAVDPAGNAYVVGQTTSTNFSGAALRSSLHGTNDAFLAKISLEPTLAAVATGDQLQVKWRAFSPEYSLETSTNSAALSPWTPISASPIQSDGWHTVTFASTNSGGFFRLRRP